MTTPLTDHPTETQGPEAPADGRPEPESTGNPAPPPTSALVAAGVTHPVTAAMQPASGLSAAARTAVSAARRGANGLVARLPGTLKATRAGTRGAVGALQTLPDPTLRSLAATSVGLGVGLYLTRSRRIAVVAGMVPALLMGAAIVVRPAAPTLPGESGA